MDNLIFDVTVVSNSCIGLVFKGYKSLFKVKNRVELRQGIRLLKRQSCPGCSNCMWLMDDINESIACGNVIFPEIENEKLYSVRMVNISRDWESGFVDDYDLEIYLLGD
jgi:hypothetical protein